MNTSASLPTISTLKWVRCPRDWAPAADISLVPKALITYLRYNLPGFVFSVGISPPLAGATLASIRLLRKNPTDYEGYEAQYRLFFVAEAKKRNLDICLAGHSAIIPILVGQDEHAFFLSNKMRENGVFVPPGSLPRRTEKQGTPALSV